ncbi:ABC transporter permease [Flavitalea flava]
MENTEIEIIPPKKISFDFKELWQNRELIYFFTWKDIKVKYKQTFLGILWAVLQPLMMMILFYVIFSRSLHINTGKIPYPLYAFCGLILWGLFSTGITNSSENMVNNANIIRKVYFPRLILPISSMATSLIDFAIAFGMLILLFIFYKQPVHWSMIYCLPAGIVMTLISSLGIGLLFASLNIKYRDVRYLLPFLMQVLFFASQIVYPISNLNNKWLKYLLYCNPFNGAFEVFKYPLQTGSINTTGLWISLFSMFIFLFVGLVYFKKTEVFFADLI